VAVISAAVATLLLGAATVGGNVQSVLLGIADKLPDRIVEEAFAATASGVLVIAVAVAALMLAAALTMAAVLTVAPRGIVRGR